MVINQHQKILFCLEKENSMCLLSQNPKRRAKLIDEARLLINYDDYYMNERLFKDMILSHEIDESYLESLKFELEEINSFFRVLTNDIRD